MRYEYAPKPNRKKEKILRNIALSCGALLFSASFVPSVAFPGILQFLSVCAFSAAIYLQTGRILKNYVYTVTSDEEGILFEIREIVPRHDTVVCRLSGKDISEILPGSDERAKEICRERDRKRFYYLSEKSDKNAYLLAAEVGGEKLAVCFPADERLISILKTVDRNICP